MSQKEYGYVKKYIKDAIFDFAEHMISWPCKINVHLKKSDKKELEQSADVYVRDKKYNLNLYEVLINRIFMNRDRHFQAALLHEFQHICDMQKAIECPFTNYEINKVRYSSKEEYLVKMGFGFWQEFRAYVQSYITFFKYDIDNKSYYQTILELYKIFRLAKKISAMKTNPLPATYEDFKAKVDKFVYEFTKYFAYIYIFNSKKDYSSKTKSMFGYKYLNTFVKKAIKQINNINKKPFNKNFNKHFSKLGLLIFKHFYEPFSYDIRFVDNKCVLVCAL